MFSQMVNSWRNFCQTYVTFRTPFILYIMYEPYTIYFMLVIRRRREEKILKNKWISILSVSIIAILILFLFLSLKGKPSTVKINNMEQAKQYLESHTFDDISMMQLYNQFFVYNSSDQKIKLEELKIGLTTDYKVRVMIMNVIDTSNAELKSCSIQYNKETNYLNVIEKQGEENKTRPSATEVLTKLDKYKNRITFSKGNYSYYNVNFYSSGSIGPGDNLYAINDQGVHIIKDKMLEGLIFMVYGDPIKKEDSPIYYIMTYQWGRANIMTQNNAKN